MAEDTLGPIPKNVGHLISSEGTSFTSAKRLKVLDLPLHANEKAILQFIGLVNYFRDHVPKMAEMVKPLRALIDVKKYKHTKQLNWTEESTEAFHFQGLRSVPCPWQGGTQVRNRCFVEVMREQRTSTTDIFNDGTSFGSLGAIEEGP